MSTLSDNSSHPPPPPPFLPTGTTNLNASYDRSMSPMDAEHLGYALPSNGVERLKEDEPTTQKRRGSRFCGLISLAILVCIGLIVGLSVAYSNNRNEAELSTASAVTSPEGAAGQPGQTGPDGAAEPPGGAPSMMPMASPTTLPTTLPTNWPTAWSTDSPSSGATVEDDTNSTAMDDDFTDDSFETNQSSGETGAPVDAPADAPVEAPADAPVEAPADAPVASPDASPVASPDASPVASPVESPTA